MNAMAFLGGLALFLVLAAPAPARDLDDVPVVGELRSNASDVARGLRQIEAIFKPVAEKVHKWHHSNRDTKGDRLKVGCGDCGSPNHEPKLTGLEPLSPAQRRAIAAAR